MLFFFQFDYLYDNLKNYFILYKINLKRIKKCILFICVLGWFVFWQKSLIFIMKNLKIGIIYKIIRKEKKEENQIEVFFENCLFLSFFNFVILYVCCKYLTVHNVILI